MAKSVKKVSKRKKKISNVEKLTSDDSVIILAGVKSLGENELSRVFDTDQYGVIFHVQGREAIVEIGTHNDMLYTYNIHDLKRDKERRYRKNSNS